MPETVRLPVLGLLGDSLRDVFGHLGGLVRIAWPYYALAALCAVLGYGLAGGSALAEAVATVLGPGTASVLVGLAVLACTVKWQRHVLLSEPLHGIAPLSLRVLRYWVWSVLIGLVCALPLLAAAALGYAIGLVGDELTGTARYRIGPAGLLLGGAGGIAAALLFLRLSLVLPAISADDRSVSFARSWQLTRGNVLRLFAAFLLLTMGLAFLGAAMGLVQGALEAAADRALLVPLLTGLLLQAGVNLLASMGAASLIARAYLKLARPAAPGTAVPP